MLNNPYNLKEFLVKNFLIVQEINRGSFFYLNGNSVEKMNVDLTVRSNVLIVQASQPDDRRTCLETKILPSFFANCKSVLVKDPIIC